MQRVFADSSLETLPGRVTLRLIRNRLDGDSHACAGWQRDRFVEFEFTIHHGGADARDRRLSSVF